MRPIMRKTVDEFFNRQDDKDINPLDFITKKELDRQVGNLDAYQLAIEHEVPDFAIDRTYECFDTVEDLEVRRVLIFSKGMQEDVVIINPEGQICMFDSSVDRELLATIGNTMNAVVRRKAPPKDN